MEQARPDSTLLPATQIEAEHRLLDRDHRIAQLLTARPTTPLPEPGSAEAKAAFKAACREHTIRSAPLQDCPELMRSNRDVWTAKSLVHAMETGDVTPAECARLTPIATERELRHAEIAHELNIGALFALAYADEYPIAASENAPASAEPDPILAVIERHRAARAATVGLDDGVDKEGYEDAQDARIEALGAVENTQPTTVAGVLALARHMHTYLREDAGTDQYTEASAEGLALSALIKACLALSDTPIAPASEPATPAIDAPIFSAVAASRRAEAEMTAFARTVEGRSMTDAERGREEAIEREQQATRAAVWATVPTTAEGRAALVQYVTLQAELTFGADWRAKMEEEFCGDFVLALIAAIEAETAADLGPDGAIAELADEFCRAYRTHGEFDRAVVTGDATEAEWLPHHDAVVALAVRLAETKPTTMVGMALKCLGPIGLLAWQGNIHDDPADLDPHERVAAEFQAANRDGSLAPILPGQPPQGKLTADRAWAVAQASAVDLSNLTILELNNLYNRFNGLADDWSAVSSQPWARASADDQFHVPTAGGRIVDREQDRAGEIRNRIAEEIRHRTPANELERNMRLETLIQFELLCEISLEYAPELRAEIAQAWGA